MPIIQGNEKLGATVVDAIATKYQHTAEMEGNSHWAVLSAWFGPIVRKEVVEGRHVRTTQESLTSLAASHWNAFQVTKSVISKAPPLKIRIPAGRIAQKA